MRSFDYSRLYDKAWDTDILNLVAKIHERKGRQDLFIRQKSVELDRLVEIAKIWSTEASNRMEGIVTTSTRMKQLFEEKTTPRNRAEDEIMGYRDVLKTIHESNAYIPIRPSYILQLHRDLLKRAGFSYGGQFKNVQNYINETKPDGTVVTRFTPIAPCDTPDAVENLCNAYEQAIANEKIDSLLLIPIFICDFLCIHPFNDGNGRMSRLLTLLLLYRSGYIVGKYISIERMIENSKELYYECLRESSENWYENKNDYTPFVKYMLGVIVGAYREFSSRIKLLITQNISKPERIEEIIKNTLGTITKKEIAEKCPDISVVTIQRTLAELLTAEKILKIGGGRYTKYTWNNE